LTVCAGKKRPVLIVGGTGLYLKCLTAGLTERGGPDPVLRARWERIWKSQGIEALRTELRSVRPDLYAALADPRNPRRLIRALEIASAGGGDAPTGRWTRGADKARMVGLKMATDQLRARILERVRKMYAAGFLDEVRDLLRGGLKDAPTAGQAIGYAEAWAHLEGGLTLDATIERTAARTRQLAKRQMTWFRHQAEVEWVEIDASETAESIAPRVWAKWQALGPASLSFRK
jgi:tRNA dimethylallyltransferase